MENGCGVLPRLRTRFFGRDAELGELFDVVLEAPLVSLVGAPGCGKSRLEIELGLRLRDRAGVSVSFVGLEPVAGDNVVSALAAGLAVGERPGRALIDGVIECLAAAPEPVVLVLDGCEHLAETVADVVHRVVTECPNARVLATSQAVLGVPGERVWALDTLDLPAAADLFVDRARLASSRFRLAGEADAAAVREVCRLVDRLPLAVELVAAWTRVLSLGQIVTRLDRAVPLLVRDGTRSTARQQTMAAAIDRSCLLLAPEARGLFEQLSVFAGRFDLDAAEAVAGNDGRHGDTDGGIDVLGTLRSLVDHSLVVADGDVDGRMRYHVLAPVRQCAAARLDAAGLAAELRRRHALHYLALVERLDPAGMQGVAQPVSLREVAPDEANLLAALDWANRQPGDLALRLASALAVYWLADGRVTDGRACLEELLGADAGDRALRAQALDVAGALAWRAGDYAAADSHLDQALTLSRQLGDVATAASALITKAKVAASGTDAPAARAACHTAVAAAERSSVTASFWALVFLAWSHYTAGEPAEGDHQMRAAAALHHRVAPRLATITVAFGLQYGAFLIGDSAAQRRHLQEIAAELDLGEFGLQEEADWLGSAAALAAVEDRGATAIRLLGAAVFRLIRVGSHYPEAPSNPIHARLAEAWDTLGPERAQRLFDEGATLAWPTLVAQAMTEPTGDEHPVVNAKVPKLPLTPREAQVAAHLARGMTNGEVAAALFVSRRTVESHLESIRRKLGFTNRNQITIWFLQATSDDDPPQ
jgi:predicted ATPase/DNA-binding CsgD family transcriptional regulator